MSTIYGQRTANNSQRVTLEVVADPILEPLPHLRRATELLQSWPVGASISQESKYRLAEPKGFGSGSATYLWQEEHSHNSSFEPCTNLYRFSKQNVAPEMESTSVCGPFSLSAQPITPNPVHILLTDPVHIHSLPRPISGMGLHGRRKESLGEWRQRCCCCGSGPVHLGAAPSVGTDLEKFEEK